MVVVGTGWVEVVVVCVVVPVEATVLRPRAEGFWVVGNGLGRQHEREEEPSIKGVPSLPSREAGLLVNAEMASTVS